MKIIARSWFFIVYYFKFLCLSVYLLAWNRKRFDILLAQERERLLHDTTVPNEQLAEKLLLAAKRIDRQIREEGHSRISRLVGELKQKTDNL